MALDFYLKTRRIIPAICFSVLVVCLSIQFCNFFVWSNSIDFYETNSDTDIEFTEFFKSNAVICCDPQHYTFTLEKSKGARFYCYKSENKEIVEILIKGKFNLRDKVFYKPCYEYGASWSKEPSCYWERTYDVVMKIKGEVLRYGIEKEKVCIENVKIIEFSLSPTKGWSLLAAAGDYVFTWMDEWTDYRRIYSGITFENKDKLNCDSQKPDYYKNIKLKELIERHYKLK